MPNIYYKGGGGAYIAHASKHIDGGDDEITLPLDLGAIPNNLIGKNADKVDGYDAGNVDGKVLVLPNASEGQIIKRTSSGWVPVNLGDEIDISWRRFIKPNQYYPLPIHKPGSTTTSFGGMWYFAQPFILPASLNITQIYFYCSGYSGTGQIKIGFYNDTGNFQPGQRLWYATSPNITGTGGYTISVSYSVPKNTKLWIVYISNQSSNTYKSYSSSDILQPFFHRDTTNLSYFYTQLQSSQSAPSFDLPTDLSSVVFDFSTGNPIEFLFKLVYV